VFRDRSESEARQERFGGVEEIQAIDDIRRHDHGVSSDLGVYRFLPSWLSRLAASISGHARRLGSPFAAWPESSRADGSGHLRAAMTILFIVLGDGRRLQRLYRKMRAERRAEYARSLVGRTTRREPLAASDRVFNPLHGWLFEASLNFFQEVLRKARLDEKGIGTGIPRAPNVLRLGRSRDDNDDRIRPPPSSAKDLNEGVTIELASREHKIRDDDVRSKSSEDLEGTLGRRGPANHHAMAMQEGSVDREAISKSVDDQHAP
jgi:hypothetical protein